MAARAARGSVRERLGFGLGGHLDVRAAGLADAHGMNQITVPVHLELSIGDELSGRAVYAAGTARRFRGVTGLLAMIDALVEEARAGRLELHAEDPTHDPRSER